MRIAVLNRLDNGEMWASAAAAGLEMRDPTADRRLIEYSLALPAHQYLRDGQTRWLLYRLMKDTLPPEILNANSKGLQAADWHESSGQARPEFTAALERLEAHATVGRYLDLVALRKALDNWPKSGWGNERVAQAYRLKLLRGMAVGAFVRYADDRNK